MNIVFVSGPPRSGTTLIQRMLQNGKRYVPECTYLTKQIALYQEWTTFVDPTRFFVFLRDEDTALATFREISRLILQPLVDDLDHEERLILKDPGLSVVLPSVRKLFPGSKIISIVREPFDVMASMKEVQARSSKAWDLQAVMETVYLAYFQIAKFADLDDQNSHVVRYEDIVNRDPLVVNGLEKFLGFPFSWDRNEAWTLDENDPFFVHTYSEPVTPTRVGRFVDILTDEEIKRILDVFAGIRLRWNYA
ncbi:MAG: sulfotransferase [Rhizobiaceae bacterium]|nr:sulfotransferase [Rhizobiaceae bacterium]